MAHYGDEASMLGQPTGGTGVALLPLDLPQWTQLTGEEEEAIWPSTQSWPNLNPVLGSP